MADAPLHYRTGSKSPPGFGVRRQSAAATPLSDAHTIPPTCIQRTPHKAVQEHAQSKTLARDLRPRHFWRSRGQQPGDSVELRKRKLFSTSGTRNSKVHPHAHRCWTNCQATTAVATTGRTIQIHRNCRERRQAIAFEVRQHGIHISEQSSAVFFRISAPQTWQEIFILESGLRLPVS
jgi:hypothetical protein